MVTSMRPNQKSLSLQSLKLDLHNPRLDIQKDDNAALSAIIAQQSKKIIYLAEEIVKQGFMADSLFYVMPVQGNNSQYIVLDGNRRLTALRILQNPDLVAGTKLKNKINSLKKIIKKDTNLPSHVDCLVFPSRKEATPYLEKKHSGPDKGRGVVPWGSIEKRRFKERQGNTPDRIVNLLDFLQDAKVPIPDKFPITNLERLLSSPDVRKKLGVQLKGGLFFCAIEKEDFVRNMAQIINELAQKGAVNRIRTVPDRVAFVDTLNLPPERPAILWEPRPTGASTPSANASSSSQKDTLIQETLSAPKKQQTSTQDRKFLIAKETKYNIQSSANPRLNNIYRELKKLDISLFPNAGAVLFRVFLELSIEIFIQDKHIPTPRDCKDMKLIEKLNIIRSYLKNNGFDEKKLKGIDVAISNKDNISSINTFNAYVHNSSFSPDPQSLKTAWDNLLPLFDTIWQKDN